MATQKKKGKVYFTNSKIENLVEVHVQFRYLFANHLLLLKKDRDHAEGPRGAFHQKLSLILLPSHQFARDTKFREKIQSGSYMSEEESRVCFDIEDVTFKTL